MLSLRDNPPLKPTHVSSLGEIAGDWFVGHTKSRNEKRFAHDLVRRGIAYFLPMVEAVTFSGGRRRRGMTPLFPGYVFFAGDGEARSAALATGRLCQVIPVADRPGFVGEIAQVDAVLSVGGDVAFFPHVAVGRRVRVVRGSYEGLHGTVVEHDRLAGSGEVTVVLSVSVLGTGASIRVPPSLLASADLEAEASPLRPAPSFVRAQPPPRQPRGRPLPREVGVRAEIEG